jgi:hypothetical protein
MHKLRVRKETAMNLQESLAIHYVHCVGPTKAEDSRLRQKEIPPHRCGKSRIGLESKDNSPETQRAAGQP